MVEGEQAMGDRESESYALLFIILPLKLDIGTDTGNLSMGHAAPLIDNRDVIGSWVLLVAVVEFC